MRCDLVLIGFGHVGRRVVGLLGELAPRLARDEALYWRIVGVATRRHGCALDPGGIDGRAALAAVERDGSIAHLHQRELGPAPPDTEALLRGALALERGDPPAPLVVLEATPLDIQAGQPARRYVESALTGGAHVATTNKGPVAFAYRALRELADRHGVSFLFEGAVMDGVPVFNLVRETLPGVQITGFRGVVNATTNYVLTEMERGRPLEDAVREMQAAGIAEADPTLDLDGWDAAAKTAALANVWLDADLTPHDVARSGVRHLTTAAVTGARQRGRRIKLVASATRRDGRLVCRVTPEELPPEDPLAALEGQANMLVLQTDLVGEIAIGALSGGLTQTAYALVSDLVTIHRRLRRAL